MQTKFRGLNLKWGTWAYGYYCVIADKHYIIERDVELADVDIPCPEHGINGFAEVDPETVGMFIGQKDKNGIEIYGAVGKKGGDIVKIPSAKQAMVVIYQPPSFVMKVKNKSGYSRAWSEFILSSDQNQFQEIIGSVALNPEL
ncbi:MAG: YopX family protein [Dehalococcoidia bacterium]|nr:YopX family protein [Dehalococcoidia bacterium]